MARGGHWWASHQRHPFEAESGSQNWYTESGSSAHAGYDMSKLPAAILCGLLLLVGVVQADDVLYRYEGDVLPYDPSAEYETDGDSEE